MTTPQSLLATYLAIKDERLTTQKRVDELKRTEDIVLAELKLHMTVEGTVSYGGMLARFSPVRKPEVVDWNELHDYIKSTGNFSLLHNRLTESAVKEIWETGDDVPGVVAHDFYELKVTKIK